MFIAGGIQSLDWTGLDWNGGLDQICDCIVFAHAQTFKRECTFAPALQSTKYNYRTTYMKNNAGMNNIDGATVPKRCSVVASTEMV